MIGIINQGHHPTGRLADRRFIAPGRVAKCPSAV